MRFTPSIGPLCQVSYDISIKAQNVPVCSLSPVFRHRNWKIELTCWIWQCVMLVAMLWYMLCYYFAFKMCLCLSREFLLFCCAWTSNIRHHLMVWIVCYSICCFHVCFGLCVNWFSYKLFPLKVLVLFMPDADWFQLASKYILCFIILYNFYKNIMFNNTQTIKDCGKIWDILK